jgi:hypothetical protein
VPPDLVDQVESHVFLGPAGPAIIHHVYATAPAFAILGDHAHRWLRGLLTRDTTSEVMRGVRCPVWVDAVRGRGAPGEGRPCARPAPGRFRAPSGARRQGSSA